MNTLPTPGYKLFDPIRGVECSFIPYSWCWTFLSIGAFYDLFFSVTVSIYVVQTFTFKLLTIY